MRRRNPTLRTKPSAGVLIGGMFGQVERAVTNRPPVVAEIDRAAGRERFERHGFEIVGLDEEVERREPEDRSGARL